MENLKLNRRQRSRAAVLLFLASSLLGLSPVQAARFGLTFHAVQVVDENNQRVTGITSVSIYLPGTTTEATIYRNPDLDTPITQPITTSSTNTTLSNGAFEWWGPDGYSYSVTDGSNRITSDVTLTSSDGTIVFTQVTLTASDVLRNNEVGRIEETGTAKSVLDILKLSNSANAADMDGTGAGLLFEQWYFDGSTPARATAGRISVVAETDWTSAASTQHAKMVLSAGVNGGVQADQVVLDSDGSVTLPIGELVVGNATTDLDDLRMHIAGASVAPSASGAAQSGLLRLSSFVSSGSGTVLDFGIVSPTAWLQASNFTEHGTDYTISLNPNGGNVAVNSLTATSEFYVVQDVQYANTEATSVAHFENSGGTNSDAAIWITPNGTGDAIIDTRSGVLQFRSAGVQKANVSSTGSISMLEKTSADTNIATYGQVWVKNDAPNTLYFTDDAGTDAEISLVGDAPTAHVHDADTLQLDAVSSDGGAFAFTTSAAVTFSQTVNTAAGKQLGVGRAATQTIDAYAGSGGVGIFATSDSVASGEAARLTTIATGNSLLRQAQFGVIYYDQSGASGSNAPAGYFALNSGDAALNFFWTDDTDDLRISATQTHIGSTNGTVVGDQTSDERGKDNIRGISYGLETLKELVPIEYDRKGVHKLGFGAQTTRLIIPETVYDTGENIFGDEENTQLAMQYVQIIPVLVKAVQELVEQIEATVPRDP